MALGRRRGSRTDDTRTQFNVDLKGVSQSAVAIGDNIAINTPAGSRLIRTVGSEAVPEPRLRPLPVIQRPERAEPFVGRTAEVSSAGKAAPGTPFQVHGREGIGKSALLKQLSLGLPQGEEGVVHAKVRRRGVYDIQAQLFKLFWECEVRFTPAPEEMVDFLGERRALVVLDDVGLDRSDLEELIETSPGCTLVIGSEQQTLWSGRAERLAGLDAEAALDLIELRLERPLAAEERAPAVAVAQALEGHPQRLVEAVAGVRARSTSFEQLARGPTWDLVAEAVDAERLNEAQHRILAVLRAAETPLGTERIAEFADVPDAAGELAALERDGWVRSASPRYRLAREFSPADGELFQQELSRQLAEWAKRRASPEEVAEEAELIERVLEGDTDAELKVAVARATEGKLALAGMLDSWERVLNAGLKACRRAGDEAHMRHQLGTRLGLIGQDRAAIEYLERALELREQIRDKEGAEVTRHNLQQLRGGGSNGLDSGNGGGPGWPRPRLGPPLAVLGALVVGAGIYAFANDGDPVRDVVAPKPPPSGPPAIRIEQPTRGGRYAEGEKVLAAYSCAAARDARLSSCRGTVGSGSAINTAKGSHVFRVTARDSEGRRREVRVPYSVSATSTSPAADETKPTIELRTPSEGAVYRVKSRVRADFTCADRGGSGVESCTGSVADGEQIDTRPGTHEFEVTAVDRAGTRNRETVTYRVERRPSPDATNPMISITSPANDARYRLSATELAVYSCEDAGGSGIASCEGSVANGQPIDTKASGPHTFTVTARDRAGNEMKADVTYYVYVTDPRSNPPINGLPK